MDETRLEQIEQNISFIRQDTDRIRWLVAIIAGIVLISFFAQVYFIYETWQAMDEVSRTFDKLRIFNSLSLNN